MGQLILKLFQFNMIKLVRTVIFIQFQIFSKRDILFHMLFSLYRLNAM